MIVQGNKALRQFAFRWPMAFALFFMAMLITNVATAVGTDYMSPVMVDTPDTNGEVTATHEEHEMKISMKICENPDCEKTFDCEMTCSISGSCTSSMGVGPSSLIDAVTPLGTRHLSAFSNPSYTSTQPNSLLRPPIS